MRPRRHRLQRGGLYAALRDDIASGTHTVPDFAHAVRLTQLLGSVGRAAENGEGLGADGWPTN